MNAFNVRKAAQVTAYFALRDGGSIDVLKLAKLTYLAERECLDEYELPLTGDAAVAMPHGPALTNTLDHVNGYAREDAEWNRLIADRAGFRIGIASKDISLQSLRGLSDADRELLGRVWDRYGHLDGFALRDLTHAMCKEWTDPLGSSRPITYSEILVALGKDDVPSILETIEISNAMRPPNAPTAGRAHAQSA